MSTIADIRVTGTENVEEIYFLIRTGVWHQEHLTSFLALREDTAYSQGIQDSRDDGYSPGDIDDAYTRGYDNGHNEGYKDGYADGNRENSYDNYR